MAAPEHRSLHVGPGDRLGRWTLQRALGRGAFGSVYVATDPAGATGALKCLPGIPGDELRALGRITHPAVVSVLDSGGPDPHWMVMSLASGQPLTAHLGLLPPEEVARIGGVLCSALAAIHGAGLVHGDIKPDNIVLDEVTGEVRIVDFGLSGANAGGTPRYAAPEVLGGSAPSAAADCYALAMSLWALSIGSQPATDAGSLLKRAHQAPALELTPAWLSALLQAWLCPDPARRPSSRSAADVFEAHGVELPAPTGNLVRRKAGSTFLMPEALNVTLSGFLAEGGSLHLSGPVGSGRTAIIQFLARELGARGERFVRLSTAEQARAVLDGRAAHGGSPTWVLVDDHDQLDADTRALVARLDRRAGVHLAVLGNLSEADHPQRIPPFPANEISELVSALLGAEPPVELLEVTHRESAGRPGALVDVVVGAINGGGLTWHRSRWVLDAPRLAELQASGALSQRAVDGLQAEIVEVGALLAAARRPLTLREAQTLFPITAELWHYAIAELEDLGWVQRGPADSACCLARGPATTLLDGCPDPVGLHRRLLSAWTGPPDPLLGWYVVGAVDAGAADRLGASCLTGPDMAQQSRLAKALWALSPSPALALPVVQALTSHDQIDDALAVAEQASAVLTEPTAVARLALQTSLLHSRGSDWHQALIWLRTAESVLGEVPEVLDVRARVHFRAELYGPALTASRALADGAPPTDDTGLAQWLQHRAVWAQSAHQVHGIDAALAVLSDVEPGLGGHLAAGALLDGVRGRLLWHGGEVRSAADAFARATAGPRRLGAIEHARLCNNAGLAFYQMGLPDKAIESWEQARLGFERAEQWPDMASVLVNLCQGLREAGRWERALQVGAAAVDLAREHELANTEMVALGNWGDAHLALGDYPAAEALYEASLGVEQAHSLPQGGGERRRRLAELAVLTRDPRALALATDAYDSATAEGDAAEAARAEILMLVARVRDHQTVDADGTIGALEGRLTGTGDAATLAWVRRWCAECLLQLGRAEEAGRMAGLTVDWARDAHHRHLLRDAEALLTRARDLHSKHTDRPAHRLLQTFIQLSRANTTSELVQLAAHAMVDVLGVERAFVLLPSSDGSFAPAAQAGVVRARLAGPSQSVLDRVITRRREVLAADLEERADLRIATSVLAMDLRAAMCLPILDGEKLLGLVYVDSSFAVGRPLEGSADLLRSVADFLVGPLSRLP